MKAEGNVNSMLKTDVVDYFPRTREYYPGYVKMAVFRERLKLLITATSIGPDRSLLLMGVDSTDWRPEDLTAKLQSELRKKAVEYRNAAVLDPVTNYAGGKVVDKASGLVKTGISKVASNPKVNAKVGKAVNNITKDFEWGEMKLDKITTKEVRVGKITVKSQTFEPKMNVVKVNIVDFSTDHTIGYCKDKSQNWLSNKTSFSLPQGVDVSLNNEMTRSWLTRFGLPEEYASIAWGLIDALTDFFPLAVITKSIEGFIFNVYLSFRYWNDARSMEETRKFFDEQWKKITTELKKYIKEDLKSLSDKEFNEMCDLLYLDDLDNTNP